MIVVIRSKFGEMLFVETHVVVELNSPVLLLGMFENFTPALIKYDGIMLFSSY